MGRWEDGRMEGQRDVSCTGLANIFLNIVLNLLLGLLPKVPLLEAEWFLSDSHLR